jgi:hypothetical protein
LAVQAVEGHVTEDDEIVWPVIESVPGLILVEGDIEGRRRVFSTPQRLRATWPKGSGVSGVLRR